MDGPCGQIVGCRSASIGRGRADEMMLLLFAGNGGAAVIGRRRTVQELFGAREGTGDRWRRRRLIGSVAIGRHDRCNTTKFSTDYFLFLAQFQLRRRYPKKKTPKSLFIGLNRWILNSCCISLNSVRSHARQRYRGERTQHHLASKKWGVTHLSIQTRPEHGNFVLLRAFSLCCCCCCCVHLFSVAWSREFVLFRGRKTFPGM